MNKYCIAICDDEEPVRCLLREWTRTSTPGAEVKEYSGGKELLKDIDEGLRLDVLFLDIALEEGDGFETAKELEKKRVCALQGLLSFLLPESLTEWETRLR